MSTSISGYSDVQSQPPDNAKARHLARATSFHSNMIVWVLLQRCVRSVTERAFHPTDPNFQRIAKNGKATQSVNFVASWKMEPLCEESYRRIFLAAIHCCRYKKKLSNDTMDMSKNSTGRPN